MSLQVARYSLPDLIMKCKLVDQAGIREQPVNCTYDWLTCLKNYTYITCTVKKHDINVEEERAAGRERGKSANKGRAPS